MKFLTVCFIAVFVLTTASCWLAGQSAATVVVQDGTEQYTTNIGDYAEVAGNVAASSPGQVLEILGGPSTPPLQTNGSESNSNTIAMGALWDVMNAGGITATSRLSFGFALNESGPVGSNWIMITELDMSFDRPGGGIDTFSLSPDSIQIYNYHQGQNTSEAIIALELGFDFMTEYSSASIEDFTIFSTIESTSDWFELYILSSAFTEIPEPSLLLALGLGLLSLRRR